MHRPLVNLSLLSMTLLALADRAAAEVISDDAVKLTIGVTSQERLDIGRGSSVDPASGSRSTYAPIEGIVGQPDDADFSMRRLRLTLKGAYQQDWIFQLQLQADNLGKASPSTTAANANTVGVYDAWAGRRFTGGSTTQQLTAGLQTACVQMAQFRGTTLLLPTNRAASALFSPRGVGVAYRLEAPVVSLGIDVQNNLGDDAAVGGGGVAAQDTYGEGMVYDARLSFTGTGDWAAAWQESFAGKSGHGFVIGFDVGLNKRDRMLGAPFTANGSVDSTLYGVEAVLHLDGLSALVYHRTVLRTATADGGVADPADTAFARRQYAMGIQGGYAFPFMGCMLEPAARYEKIDNNADVDGDGTGALTTGAKNFGTAEFGTSGRQIELGLNLYFNGHKNKIGVELIHWTGEDTVSAAGARSDGPTANILRVQHQLWF